MARDIATSMTPSRRLGPRGGDRVRSTAHGLSKVDAALLGAALVILGERVNSASGDGSLRFLPAGPFAILPLTANRASLVWTERSDLAPAFMELPEAEFTAEIQRRVGDFLGPVHVVGDRFRYPLSLVLAHAFRADRLALIGDAAHGIHPIAGQGFNLGLRDVAALAECLTDAAALGLDLGDAGVLTDYERWRRTDSVALTAVTDILNRLFSNDLPPVRLARDLGLAAVHRSGPLRRFFMRHAMGDVGDRPALLKA